MPDPSILVLTALSDGEERSIHDLVEQTSLSPDAIRRVLVELEEKKHVHVVREKVERWVPTETGKRIVERGYLPEEFLYSVLVGKKGIPLQEVMKEFSAMAVGKYGSTAKEAVTEFSVAFGLCKRKNFVEVISGGLLVLTPLGEKGLNNIPEKPILLAIYEEGPPGENPGIISELHARGLIATKTHTNENARITNEGKQFLRSYTPDKKAQAQIGMLTPQLLASGDWKKSSFKSYDVNAGVEERFPGRIHPLRQVTRDVRRIMVELGFQEDESPLVESSFWNMDVMFIPQDHPARDIQDTFYLPGRAVLPEKDLVARVKAMHEHGGKSGSKGFGYEWDPRIAMQLLLRTHGSATTFRTLSKNLPVPSKTFSIGRVFRNEAVDATHLAEFYQVDGLVMGEGLTLRHLMGIITEFYAKLGLTKIKFKPTYNPYTEPSMEALAYHPKLGKWVEIINSGMFRPETLAPLGIHVPVISWGFGLERLALFVYEKEMLKDITGPEVDVDFIRKYAGTKHGVVGGK